MQQQMGSLSPHVPRLTPQLRAADGRRSFRSGHGPRLLHTSWAHLGRVTALDAAPKSCLLRDAAINVCKNSRLLDHVAQAISESYQLDTVRFVVQVMVQDDDLDEYGVVNNAIYARYIHRGRDLLLENLGINVSYLAATGKAMALSELNLKYFAPLRYAQLLFQFLGNFIQNLSKFISRVVAGFVVKVKPVQIKGVRMIVHHMIETLPDHKVVLEAKGTVVFLNRDYCPTRVFPDVSAKTREMFPCMEG